VIFTLGFSRLYLKERVKRFEIGGLMLVGTGVALALWGGL
jgi:drug/metabolite transporter (DMT)-like permease